MKKRLLRRVVCLLLAGTMLFGIFQTEVSFFAAKEKNLSVTQAKSMALADSSSYSRIKSKIALKEVSYKQAVKAIQLKIKNKTTFRWSPILEFSFPEKLNFEDESNMVYKPAQMMNEITELKHDLADEVFAVYESAQQAFLTVYTLQEKVAFEEKQIAELESTLAKNKGRVLLGLGTQADVDAIQKSLDSAKDKLAQDTKSFLNAKIKLGDLINLDVSSGYHFTNPYVTAEIPREVLDDLVAYTLDNDQAYYEAKMDTQLSLLQLNSNYNLLAKQYGGNMNIISPYVQQVKKGQKIDSNAFKLSYDRFLQAIDAPWAGSWKILFIRIPKEWLKGQIDGVRYIEDEPYALFENALEYQDVLAEQKAMAKELETQVRDTYESIMSARSSYLKIKEEKEETKAQLEKEKILNTLGQMTFEEYTESKNQYESLQIEELEALELYSSMLFSFDRLTCGAVSTYLSGEEIQMEGASGGESYIVNEDAIEGVSYYIRSIVEDNMFEFGIYVPEDVDMEATHYEFWVDDYRVGEKMPIDKTLRHLTLSLTGEERVFVRLYNGEEVLDDCKIDPTAYQGPLEYTRYTVVESETSLTRVIGTFEITEKQNGKLVEISLNLNSEESITSYNIQTSSGVNLLSEKLVEYNKPFVYFKFLLPDLNTVQIQCYDANEALKYTAYFNTNTYEIYMLEQ